MAPKRKSNKHWHQNSRKKRSFSLVAGLKGFICTCNNAEKQCIKETYNLLNEYANKFYGPEEALDGSSSSKEESSDDDLASEVSSLKKEAEKPLDKRRFQVIESGVKNRLFIRTTVSDPVELVHKMLMELKQTTGAKTRFLMRIIPIEITCKAYMKDIETAAGVVFDKYFCKEGQTFSIIVNRHNSDAVGRIEIIKELAEMIKFRHPENKVDLKNPQLTVLVEVMRSLCCLTVLPDYRDLQKYNIMELGSGEKSGQISMDEKDDNKLPQDEKKILVEEEEKGEEEGKEENENKEVAEESHECSSNP